VVVPAGIVNTNTEVPCSVTTGAAGFKLATLAGLAVLPMVTVLMLWAGANPVTVAVTTVPNGPEVGESVTVGVVRVKAAVATLPQASVKVNDDPEVIAGRLTTPEIAPAEVLILLVLTEAEEAVAEYEVTGGSEIMVMTIVTGTPLLVPTALEVTVPE